MSFIMNADIILRLSKYKRILQKFKALGLERVFSNNLGDATGVSSALVRKDFSLLNLPGNKRGGYGINSLLEHIKLILEDDVDKKAVVVGCGKIGTALLQNKDFAKEGIRIIAGFDVEPEERNQGLSVPVFHVNDLDQFIFANKIKVGIIAVPDHAATTVFEQMLQAGVRGFLNFTPVELRQSLNNIGQDKQNSCVIQNVNIGLQLENLFYLVNIKEKSGDPPPAVTESV
jgi:redox-sensing transcriptional repressor